MSFPQSNIITTWPGYITWFGDQQEPDFSLKISMSNLSKNKSSQTFTKLVACNIVSPKRDTIYLLESGYQVHVFDTYDGRIKNLLDQIEQKKNKKVYESNLICKSTRMESIKFENIKIDLMNVGFSLNSCPKASFSQLWERIYQTMNVNGRFVGCFLDSSSTWVETHLDNKAFTEDEVRQLFADRFKIEYFHDFSNGSSTSSFYYRCYTIVAKKIAPVEKNMIELKYLLPAFVIGTLALTALVNHLID